MADPQASLANLSPDILAQIMLMVSKEDLQEMCRSSQTFALICNDETFWSQRIIKDYGKDLLNQYPEANRKELWLLVSSIYFEAANAILREKDREIKDFFRSRSN